MITHDQSVYELVISMFGTGVSDREITRRTGVPQGHRQSLAKGRSTATDGAPIDPP